MDLKFRKSGLRILDSRFGDLLLADSDLNVTCMFTSEFLKQAQNDTHKMAWLGKKLLIFLEKHTAARWRHVEKELEKITDTKFTDRMRQFMKKKTIDSLRKIEKEIYFYKKHNHETVIS